MIFDYFSGISRLYGQTMLQQFQNAHVAVIGIGGVGSWAVEALARSGIGTLTLIDLDEICVTNINRQLHATHDSIGRLKVDIMAQRVLAINPQANVHVKQTFYSESNAHELLYPGIDVVIDAIDAVKHKCHLIATCRQLGLDVVTCGAAGGRRDPSRIGVDDLARTHDDPLLQQTRKRLRSHHGFPAAGSGNRAKKFHVTAVFSTETPVFPQCDGSVSPSRPADAPLRLSCATGYGTATPVTATFGMIAAAQALALIESRAASR